MRYRKNPYEGIREHDIEHRDLLARLRAAADTLKSFNMLDPKDPKFQALDPSAAMDWPNRELREAVRKAEADVAFYADFFPKKNPMSFVKPSKIHLIRRGDKPRPSYGKATDRLTHGVFQVQWYDDQDRPLDSELVVTGDFDYTRKTKPRKVNPMRANPRSYPAGPIVAVRVLDTINNHREVRYRRGSREDFLREADKAADQPLGNKWKGVWPVRYQVEGVNAQGETVADNGGIGGSVRAFTGDGKLSNPRKRSKKNPLDEGAGSLKAKLDASAAVKDAERFVNRANLNYYGDPTELLADVQAASVAVQKAQRLSKAAGVAHLSKTVRVLVKRVKELREHALREARGLL